MAKVFTITEGLENMGALKTGGQGSVYKAKRIGEIITAVKLLPTPIHSESEDDKNFISFQNEVQKLKKVNQVPNPHVVKILSSGLTQSGNLPFIEMEYIEGPDMEDLLKPPYDPVFPIKEIIKVADQLSYALAHCHKVDVKHGDIKSNNVKFNVDTGNYVLLDFGLAIMSEEQRRTSMRQAGAIEFMAPEQSDGLMYFQTDVYSYGVILFELLTGAVPFPLTDRGETARNRVMVAHLEKDVPDILSHRRSMLPEGWSDEKKEREMKVPMWLIYTINKCLKKRYEDRFKNGTELHRYIVNNSTAVVAGNEDQASGISVLKSENERLRTLLIQYQEAAKDRDSLGLNNHKVLSLNEALSAKAEEAAYMVEMESPRSKKKSIAGLFILLIFIIGSGFLAYKFRGKLRALKNDITQNIPKEIITKPVLNYGLYKVLIPKAYFHTTPDDNSKRTSYLIKSNDTITALKESNDFIYAEFYNSRKQLSKGWLKKGDLFFLDEFSKSTNVSPTGSSDQMTVENQLDKAAEMLTNEQFLDALLIYSELAKNNVSEADYQFGNLALRGKNTSINCTEGIAYINKAALQNYIPAKRTLGFLYVFGENEMMMQANDYKLCNVKTDIIKGKQFLLEAASEGDTTAIRFLEQANTTY